MQKVKLTVETRPNGKKVYRAFDETGNEMYKSSPTNRDYVAMLICKKGNSQYRFGRVDLIGGGDSSHYFTGHAFPFLAVLDEVEKLVFIPAKREVSYYIFTMYNGNEIYQMGASESEARGSIERRAKGYGTTSTMMAKSKLTDKKPAFESGYTY